MTIKVRQAKLRDAETISEVDIASHRVAYRPIFGDNYMADVTPDQNVKRWQGFLGGGPAESGMAPLDVLVAEVGGEVRAYAVLMPSRDDDAPEGVIGEVGGLYVHPDHWRKGTGHVLLSGAADHLKRRGFLEATLWVLEANSGARAFYEKEGWAPDGGRQIGERNSGVPDAVELRYRVKL